MSERQCVRDPLGKFPVSLPVVGALGAGVGSARALQLEFLEIASQTDPKLHNYSDDARSLND